MIALRSWILLSPFRRQAFSPMIGTGTIVTQAKSKVPGSFFLVVRNVEHGLLN